MSSRREYAIKIKVDPTYGRNAAIVHSSSLYPTTINAVGPRDGRGLQRNVTVRNILNRTADHHEGDASVGFSHACRRTARARFDTTARRRRVALRRTCCIDRRDNGLELELPELFSDPALVHSSSCPKFSLKTVCSRLGTRWRCTRVGCDATVWARGTRNNATVHDRPSSRPKRSRRRAATTSTTRVRYLLFRAVYADA